MDKKLTIKLDKNVIEKAKEYASSQKRSLSRLIESYLQSLVLMETTYDKDEIQISPFVKSISSEINLSADLDYKKEYSAYLTEKYR